jgi:endonuclease/exonuclease/phosphatase family metal-dependent hydrolase
MRSAGGNKEITVATYNIHLGIGRDGHFKPHRIAEVIGEMKADIIALQEVAMGSPGFNMLEYLRDACRLHAIAGPTLVTAKGDYGNAILTRFHATQVRRLDLSFPRREPRGALDVELDCDGQPLRLVATHLGLRPAERRAQIRRLLRAVEGAGSMPTVLIGDLNEWFLWGRPLRWLHGHFRRTPAPPTFPARAPFISLDRVWVKPRRALRRVTVHTTALSRMASDHLPLAAVLDFSGSREPGHSHAHEPQEES